MSVPSIHNHILFQRQGYGLNLSRQFPSYRSDPNACNSYGTTPLHVLSLTNYGNLMAGDLIRSGAQINAANHFGSTPLHFAVIHRNQWMTEFLIEHGADVNLQDMNGNTALHFAIQNSRTLLYLPEYQSGDGWAVRNLLYNGAYINTVNKDDETPLMWAIMEDNLDIVKVLLEFGANVNFRKNGLESCLHLASRNGKINVEIIMELVKNGACINCLDQDGKTALEVFLHCRKSDNGFESAKTFIKDAILVNFERDMDLRVGKQFPLLNDFIRKCSEEVFRMKSIDYTDSFSLCHFALGHCNADLSENVIFDKVLETLVTCRFPIYIDFIVPKLKRSYLSKKLLKLDIYTRYESCNTIVFLNRDVISEISNLSSHEDLFNFIRAYSKQPKPPVMLKLFARGKCLSYYLSFGDF